MNRLKNLDCRIAAQRWPQLKFNWGLHYNTNPMLRSPDLSRRCSSVSTVERLLWGALLLVAWGLRLHLLDRQDIWWDEARNIEVALRPLTQIAAAPELDIQPPLYYWLLHGWSLVAGGAVGQLPAPLAFVARFWSVLAGVVGVALLAALARRAGGVRAALLAALLGTLSPFWLAESQESRMYTTGFALLTAAALFFWEHWEQHCREKGALFSPASLLFVFLTTAALFTHYNVLFVLLAWYGWWGGWALLQPARRRLLGSVCAHGLATGLLLLPLAPIALRQIPGYANPNLTVVGAGDYLRQNWQAYLGGYAFDPTQANGLASLWLGGVAAVALAGLLLTARQKGRRAILGFFLAWLAGGLTLYYLAVLDRNAFHVRYASFVTPALYTLVAVGLAAFAQRSRLLGMLLAATLAAGLATAAHADLYDRRFDREHIAEVTEWLRQQSTPDDLILVDQKYPFGFYYQPYAVDAAPLAPARTAPARTAPARYLFVDINTLDQQLNQWAGTTRRVFWVQWFESDTDPRRAVHFLLNKYGRHSGEEWFQGYAIDWWELEPPTHFELAPALQPLTVSFAQAVQVVEVSLPQRRLAAGSPLAVALRWQRIPGGSLLRPLKARVALYDANGNRLAQADERLLNDRHLAPAQWQPTDRPLGVYLLPIPEGQLPGRYVVRVLVYDAESLEPLNWVDALGAPAGIEPELGRIEIGE